MVIPLLEREMKASIFWVFLLIEGNSVKKFYFVNYHASIGGILLVQVIYFSLIFF